MGVQQRRRINADIYFIDGGNDYTQAVVFLFRFGHDGSSMVVTMADAERVLDTASKTRLCRRDPELLLEVFMENCGAGEEGRTVRWLQCWGGGGGRGGNRG